MMNFKLIEATDSAGKELTPEQEKFFKASKIRNDFGDLLVCYRGTRAESNRTGFKGDIKWFTTNKDYASRFEPNLYACYLNCNKIFDCGNTDGRVFDLNPTRHTLTPEFAALLKKLDVTEELFKKLFKQRLAEEDAYKLRVFSIVRLPEFKDLVKRSGYDCIRTVEEQDNVCFGVFDNANIKLIDNINPTNSDNINENI